MVQTTKVKPFREITPDGTLKVNFHPGQTRAWLSKKRYVAVLAGSQGGKTSFGPHWLDREIRNCGPGDYLIGTSTFPLLDRKLLPEFLYVFSDLFHYGTYNDNKKVFTFHTKKTVKRKNDYVLFPDAEIDTKVFIGSAQNPESMESATVKAIWLDECVAPETLISTEIGQMSIREIVEKRLRCRVWSFDIKSGEWELKPIIRWIRLPQRKPLLNLGNLRLTGNHRVWTNNGYILTDKLITSTKYDILRVEVIKDEQTKGISSFRGNSQEDEGICQASLPRTRCEGICQFEEALSGTSRTRRGDSRTAETEIYEPCQPSLGATGRKPFKSSNFCEATVFQANQKESTVVTRRQRQTEELETGKIGGGIGVGKRVCGDYRERMVASCLQDRRGGTRVKDGDRSWQCSQSTQNRVVRAEWVDISSLLQSDGGGLDGGCSSDGYVYNLEVEDNHNYVANNYLVSNCGQKQFKRETWEAVQRRGLINKARILFTTTLYGLGWLKTDIYDEGIKGSSDIDIIQFDSIENPAFPLEEYQRMQRIMPDWKFQMFHRGRYSQPAGLIYDGFDSVNDVIEPFEIPAHWPRYVGHDFGPVNTVALWKAYDTGTGTFYTYREYCMGRLSTFDHVTNWIELSKGERIASRYGGSSTEDGWRGDFTQAGWKIEKPMDGGVESGITRVYSYDKLHKNKVFRTCKNYLSEKTTYSRELDGNYNVTDKIEDKEIYHFMDAERYMMAQFRPVSVKTGDKAPKVYNE